MPLLTEFSPREIADIHFYYGMCRGVARAARIAYIAAFPNRMQPSARNFQEVHRRFSNVGLGLAREHRQQADVIDTSIEEAVLNDVFADPTTSTRRLAARHALPLIRRPNLTIACAVVQCAVNIKNDPDMVRRATQQISVRALMCLQQHGDHFEHLMH
ncbi:hypothetical protein ACJJTC_018306 [Scirpophaga incertulas]